MPNSILNSCSEYMVFYALVTRLWSTESERFYSMTTLQHIPLVRPKRKSRSLTGLKFSRILHIVLTLRHLIIIFSDRWHTSCADVALRQSKMSKTGAWSSSNQNLKNG